MTTTIQTVRQLIEQEYESEKINNELVESIVRFLAIHEGKRYSKRLLPKIQEIVNGHVYFTDNCGLQQLKTGDITITMGHGAGCPIINEAQIRSLNICYLESAVTRNNSRIEQLNSNQPEELQILLDNYKEAAKILNSTVKYPMPDYTCILKLAGI